MIIDLQCSHESIHIVDTSSPSSPVFLDIIIRNIVSCNFVKGVAINNCGQLYNRSETTHP